jgi:hypothetical protein
MYNETISCSSHKLPLLLERVGVRRIKSISYILSLVSRLSIHHVGVRRIKSISYIPLIPTFSLKGEGAGTCVDTYALRERVVVRV